MHSGTTLCVLVSETSDRIHLPGKHHQRCLALQCGSHSAMRAGLQVSFVVHGLDLALANQMVVLFNVSHGVPLSATHDVSAYCCPHPGGTTLRGGINPDFCCKVSTERIHACRASRLPLRLEDDRDMCTCT